MPATTSKPKAAARGRTAKETTTMTATTVQPAQRSTAIADVLTDDPTLPKWRSAERLLDLACVVANRDDAGLAQHRTAYEQEQRRKSFVEFGRHLAEQAAATLDAARRAFDHGATPEQAHDLYRAAAQARVEFEAFEHGYLALDYPSVPREVRLRRSHDRTLTAAVEALRDGMKRRRLKVAAYAEQELRRVRAADLLDGGYTLPAPLTEQHLEQAAKPVRAAEQRVLDLEAELRRGPRPEPGSRRTSDDIRRYLSLVELPNAKDRLAGIRRLAPSG